MTHDARRTVLRKKEEAKTTTIADIRNPAAECSQRETGRQKARGEKQKATSKTQTRPSKKQKAKSTNAVNKRHMKK